MTLLHPKVLLPSKFTTPFTIFKIYCALKAHYQGAFDINKYGLKVRSSVESFDDRKDKVFFERLAAKHNARTCYEMMLFNFASNVECFSYELSTSGAYDFYLRYCGKLDIISQVFKQDLNKIFSLLTSSNKEYKELFRGKGHPVIFQLLLSERISVETFILINNIDPFIDEMNEQYKDDLLWASWYMRIKQYASLLTINSGLAKNLFDEVKASNT